MKIKTPIQMETFNDGVLSVYEINGEGQYLMVHERIRFSNRIIGAKRYFAAQQANSDITDLIRIPLINNISIHSTIVINGLKHEIKQIQVLDETNPPVRDLTLRQRGTFDISKVLKEVGSDGP